MGTLTIKSSSLNRTAEYKDTENGIMMGVDYRLDETNGTLISINGTIYKGQDNTYAGNFSGQMQDGEVDYSLSGVKRKDMAVIFDALTDIEQQITPAQEGGEE